MATQGRSWGEWTLLFYIIKPGWFWYHKWFSWQSVFENDAKYEISVELHLNFYGLK